MLRLVVEHQPLIDDVLRTFGRQLGADAVGYRGHVYRMFNFARALVDDPGSDDLLAAAAAFHDLGIWSNDTFDYLDPSATRAQEYLAQHHPELDAQRATELILFHHKLRRVHTNRRMPVEAFRRADLIDLSFGALPLGVPRAFISQVRETFPNAGFHLCLLRVGGAWALEHPERPVPVLRW